MEEKLINKIAEIQFNTWKKDKINEGYHAPRLCPSYESKENDEAEADLIHCNKCLADLTDYEDLMEFQKKDYKNKAESLINTFKEYGLKITL